MYAQIDEIFKDDLLLIQELIKSFETKAQAEDEEMKESNEKQKDDDKSLKII